MAVAEAVRAAGYGAKLSMTDSGKPQIDSAAGGFKFQIYFSDCEDKKDCATLQFVASFTKDASMTEKMANDWNADKSFSQAAILKDGQFAIYYDVSTVGGLTPKNFEDVLNHWSLTMGGLRTFFDAHPVPKAK